jgi:hypothetical protein
MPEDSSHFKVIAMPGWERDLRKVIRGRPAVADAVQELLVILRRDPHNRTGQYKIKKLAGYKTGEGQWRIRIPAAI